MLEISQTGNLNPISNGSLSTYTDHEHRDNTYIPNKRDDDKLRMMKMQSREDIIGFVLH